MAGGCKSVLVCIAIAATIAHPSIASDSGAPPKCRGHVAGIVGTSRGEVIRGTPRNDVIVGRGGNDVIDGRGGDDVICADDGNDRVSDESGTNQIDAGPGNDVVRNATSETTIWGAGGDDVLKVAQATIAGGPGDDVEMGDTFVLGTDTGRDLIYGTKRRIAPGAVLFFSGAPGRVVVDLAEGTVRGIGDDKLFGYFYEVSGSAYADVIRGDDQNNLLIGDPSEGPQGDDVIRGGGGPDDIEGGGGDDALYGDDANDVLCGGRGNDRIDGGANKQDNETFDFGGDELIVWCRAGGEQQFTVTADLSTGTAEGTHGSDTLVDLEDIRGSPYADTLIGNELDNRIYGDHRIEFEGAGDDTIYGRGGNDALYGGEFFRSYGTPPFDGNDSLFGEDGDDDLDAEMGEKNHNDGGPGNDECFGQGTTVNCEG